MAVPLPEFWLLLRDLTDNPESRFHARIARWKYPVSREWMMLAEEFDAANRRVTPKGKPAPKPLPRPWPDRTTKRFGGKAKNGHRTREESIRILKGG